MKESETDDSHSMKILLYGVGAIGSLVTHYLIKAGNDVTVVARSTEEVLKKRVLSSSIICKDIRSLLTVRTL